MSVADTATIEQLLAVPHGRTLVERAYDRFTLEVCSFLYIYVYERFIFTCIFEYFFLFNNDI